MTRTQKYFPPILTAAGAALIMLAALGLIGCSAVLTADNVFLSTNAQARSEQSADAKFEQDRQTILGMAGQYDVTFEFEEKMVVREG